ncbi:flagellin N-terminal helical domain-containing protein [Pseudaeromonas pectinilytica]
MAMVVNTNVMSLNAQRQLNKSQAAQNTSMERLSSGLRINSAKDDAAGLAISTGMESQTRGLNQAVRNANDGISMAQTAEGSMDEMTNILQRMRELGVQASNDTNSASNRASIQKEVDQLYSELDRISSVTSFNGVKLLDGSTKSTSLQIGANSGETLSFSIKAVTTKDLNLNAVSGLGELNGGRVNGTALLADEVTINGVSMGAQAATDAAGLETYINAQKGLTGVTADAYNVVKSTGGLDGKLASGELTINTVSLSGTSDLKGLVEEINLKVAGVTASIGENDSLVLSNTTGSDIVIGGTAAGKAGLTSDTYRGYLSLSSADGSEIKMGLGSAATASATKLQSLGFNESSGSDNVTSGAVSGAAVTAADGIKINGVALGDITGTSAADKAFAINALRDQTGVEASAKTEQSFTFDLVDAEADTGILINGTSVSFAGVTTLDGAVTAINGASLAGVVASADTKTGKLVLSSQSGQDISITTGATGDAFGLGAGATTVIKGQISLTGQNGRDVVVTSDATTQALQGTALAKLGLTDQGGNETAVGRGLSMATAANAANSIERIDAALKQISDGRADLGAIQNRLTSTISNLSNVSQNLSAANSRIRDADFAAETSSMSKAQVLQQAGTAMLSQANASSQNVLSLLR